MITILLCTMLMITDSSADLSSGIEKRFREYRKDDQFGWLIEDLIKKVISNTNCLTFISDSYYYDKFTTKTFSNLKRTPIFKIHVKDNEDLLSPNYDTLSAISQSRRKGCNTYIILIANAEKTIRFLRFGDRNRVIDTRARFIMLYDSRLFRKDFFYLWKKIVNVIFINKFYDFNRYDLTTVPFPAPIVRKWKPVRIDSWTSGKFQNNNELFIDKTSNLRGKMIHMVTFEYVPSVLKPKKETVEEDEFNEEDEEPVEYSGLEIEIMKSLSKAMNFQTVIYEPGNSDTEAWGRQQLNGTYSGLLGEMISGNADFALGNFLYTPYNLKLIDLSRPYIAQCYTFLTPESTTDNSWKTLILPFKKYMWIGVFLTLAVCTLVFYGLAYFHKQQNKDIIIPRGEEVQFSFWKDLSKLWNDQKGGAALKQKAGTKPAVEEAPSGLYLFGGVDSSLMNAYSMLLLVSLPKMPTGWSLRMFTGWWWLYCILVTVAYRASMTAILANPQQRLTIDTLDELASSPITCGGWGEQNKEFFTTSLDLAGQRVGRKFEVIYDSYEAISRVAKGYFAYYDNIYSLHYAKVKQKVNLSSANETHDNNTKISEEEKDLHIMRDCVINMPISLGMQKNSPLKPRVDKFLQRVIEAGLVKKWLADVMINIAVAESSLEKVTPNAVMDLKKFVGALVALGIGYSLATIALAAENIYWYYVVQKNPLFDKYRLDCYFGRKK